MRRCQAYSHRNRQRHQTKNAHERTLRYVIHVQHQFGRKLKDCFTRGLPFQSQPKRGRVVQRVFVPTPAEYASRSAGVAQPRSATNPSFSRHARSRADSSSPADFRRRGYRGCVPKLIRSNAIRESCIAARPSARFDDTRGPCDPTPVVGENPTLCLVAIRESRIATRPFAPLEDRRNPSDPTAVAGVRLPRSASVALRESRIAANALIWSFRMFA